MGFHLDRTESFAELTQEAKHCIQYHTASYACIQPVESLTEKISRDVRAFDPAVSCRQD